MKRLSRYVLFHGIRNSRLKGQQMRKTVVQKSLFWHEGFVGPLHQRRSGVLWMGSRRTEGQRDMKEQCYRRRHGRVWLTCNQSVLEWGASATISVRAVHGPISWLWMQVVQLSFKSFAVYLVGILDSLWEESCNSQVLRGQKQIEGINRKIVANCAYTA